MIKRFLMTIIFALAAINIFAQQIEKDSDWEKELDEKGYVVFTRYSDYKFENGNEETLLEWKLETEQDVRFEKVIETLENIELYKKIFDYCDTVRVIGKKKEGKLLYYYFDLPWPAGNIDLVRVHQSVLDSSKGIYYTNQISRPDNYPLKDVTRLKISDLHIKLIRISEEKTRFECSSRYIPEGAPDFLAKGWLPDGPVEIIENIISLSK